MAVISGFSGSGKGTLVRELLSRYPYQLSISATTRSPREGEVDGRDYFFLTTDQFKSMMQQGELLEWAGYVDHFYGTPKAFVEGRLAAGQDVILEIEMQGALQVKKIFPEALLIFVMPPDAAQLRERLVKRGTEGPDVICRRLQRAKEEISFLPQYDVLVVNDDLMKCVAQLHALIQGEEDRTLYAPSGQEARIDEFSRQLEREIESMREELGAGK